MRSLKEDLISLLSYFALYIKLKITHASWRFEDFKNKSVEKLMFKRGILQRRVWHGSMIGLTSFGVLTSGIFGGQTIISSAFPGVTPPDPRFAQAFAPSPDETILESLYDTRTNISQKPRSEIIEYEIKSGDTLSSLAEKFGISQDTLKWANDLENINALKPGQKLKILPVSGVSHTVREGDTLEKVAEKYSANAQAIVDFPFNDIPDDFKLKVGQVLTIPDGVPPQKIVPKKAPRYLAQTPTQTYQAPGGASFIWPTVASLFTQGFSWYHRGVDLANRASPPIFAADGGVVIVAGWPDGFGYGNRVAIDHGNGYRTLYAHLSNIYVSVGQTVSRGQTIGQMGSTGRSTGTHLHFEISYKGVSLNPLAILK